MRVFHPLSSGAELQRQGWNALRRRIAVNSNGTGLVLDDFVEATFVYSGGWIRHEEPWVGIFHHPQGIPPQSLAVSPRHAPQVYFQMPEFQDSLPFLKGYVALSEYHAAWLREQLPGIPSLMLHHPVPLGFPQWNPKCLDQPVVRQFGWHMRNTMLIEQIPTEWHRTRPAFVHPWEIAYHDVVREYEKRPVYPGTQVSHRLSEDEYGQALADGVCVMEVYETSANNVVVECLSSKTPLICNPHPALLEYLGPDYPLYAESQVEIASLLDRSRILEGHAYLLERNDRRDIEYFHQQLTRFVSQL